MYASLDMKLHIASTELEHVQAHVDLVINITNLTLVLT